MELSLYKQTHQSADIVPRYSHGDSIFNCSCLWEYDAVKTVNGKGLGKIVVTGLIETQSTIDDDVGLHIPAKERFKNPGGLKGGECDP